MTSSRYGLALAFLLMLLPLAGGCAARHYKRTQPGTLRGDLIVKWYKPDTFIFEPSEGNPLLFTRGGSEKTIQPGLMLTDGGSVPRPFWVLKNFSPWGYGPAFIVHDWLFHMQDCDLPGHEDYDLKTAAQIMSEVMKTLMERPDFDYGSKASMYLMYKAVQTSSARRAWTDNICKVPDEILRSAPDKVYELSF